MTSHVQDNVVAECAILDAFHHEPRARGLKNKYRLKVRAKCRSIFVKALLRIAAFGLLLLPLVEIQSSFTKSSNYLDNENVSISYKTFWITWSIESVLLIILTGDAITRGYILLCCCSNSTSEKRSGSKSYYVTYTVYVIILFATWVLVFASAGYPHLHALIIIRQLLRPYFLIFQVTMLKKALRAMFHAYTTLVLVGIFSLLLLVPLFFVIMGFALFPHHLQSDHFNQKDYVVDSDTVDEGDDYFNSSVEAYWNLIVYLSTANSPDIATPAYSSNRLSFLFFSIYYFVEGHLILNVLKASYAIKFSRFIQKSTERTCKHCIKSLKLAYEELKDENNSVKQETIKHYAVTKLNLVNEDEFKNLCPDTVMLNKAKFVYTMFNIVHETKKPFKPFNDLKDVECKCSLRLFIQILSVIVYFGSLAVAVAQFLTLTILLFTDYNDTFTEPHSPIVKALVAFSGILTLEFFLRGFLILKVCCCFKSNDETDTKTYTGDPQVVLNPTNVNDTPIQSTVTIGTTHSSSETFICCLAVFLHECPKIGCVQILVYYSKLVCRYFRKFICNLLKWFFYGHNLRLNKVLMIVLIELFDMMLLLAIIILGFLHVSCLNKGTYDNCKMLSTLIDILQVTIFIVVFRMFRLLAKIPLFGIILKSLIRVLVLLIPFLLLGYLFYYEFAILGMAIFRGVNLNDTKAAAECGTYENLKYHPYNFEDFGSSLVLLWNLMIVNNWHVMVGAYVRRTSIYSRIYFVIWWLLSETILNGILLGYLIEILSVTKIRIEHAIKDFKEKPLRNKIPLVCLFIFVPQDLQQMLPCDVEYENFDVFEAFNIFDTKEYENMKKEATNEPEENELSLP